MDVSAILRELQSKRAQIEEAILTLETRTPQGAWPAAVVARGAAPTSTAAVCRNARAAALAPAGAGGRRKKASSRVMTGSRLMGGSALGLR